MRVLLRSSFDTYTGYGNDAVDMAVWLQRMGVDVVPWPAGIMPGLPKQFTDLLTKEPSGEYDVALTFAPPFDVRPWEFAGLGRVAVGWSMWERTPLQRADMVGHLWPNAGRRARWWSQGPRSKQGRKKDWLDLMVVTCWDNVDAFSHLDPDVRYSVTPNGIDPTRFPVLDRDDPGTRPLRFLSVGMLAGRKDPFATIQAWRRAKEIEPEFDAELVLKTSTSGLHPAMMDAYPGLTIITEVWPPERLLALYASCDVYVSTSRGEGNNKPAMEFMSTGGPVMATDWSGHRNWLHPDYGYPLTGTLVEDPRTGTSDFRVDVEAAAQKMVDVWRDPWAARWRGEGSASFIRSNLSWEKVLKRLLHQISEVM